jgi:DNA-damage-inducible protein J
VASHGVAAAAVCRLRVKRASGGVCALPGHPGGAFGAFRLLLRRLAAEKALPFAPLVPNAETVAAMRAAPGGDVITVGRPSQLLASLDADW